MKPRCRHTRTALGCYGDYSLKTHGYLLEGCCECGAKRPINHPLFTEWFMRCGHPKAARIEGPRDPALYGSRATEVCTKCSHWRLSEVSKSRWQPLPVPEREDEEY